MASTTLHVHCTPQLDLGPIISQLRQAADALESVQQASEVTTVSPENAQVRDSEA